MQTRQQALQVPGLGHVLGEGRVKQAQAGKNTKGQGEKSHLKSVIPVAKKRELEEVGYLHKTCCGTDIVAGSGGCWFQGG